VNLEKLKSDFESSHENLRDSIELFHSGRRSQYQLAAALLRKLLCDVSEKAFLEKKTNPSLLPKLKEDIFLPRIGENITPLGGNNSLSRDDILEFSIYIPGITQTTVDGKSKILQLFQETASLLNLHDWLNQIVLIVNGEVITIYQLIKSVADKEAVHSDNDYNETIKSSKHFITGDDESHQIYIIAIAELILRYMDNGLLIRENEKLQFHEITGNLTGTYTFKGSMPKENFTIIRTEKENGSD
jgi:hypothetical protein